MMIDFFKKFRFSLLLTAITIIVVTATWIRSKSDMAEILAANKRYDSLLAATYMPNLGRDTSHKTNGLFKSIQALTERKSNALYDACDYHRGLFVFAYILGISALFGTIIITLLIKDGWNDASHDLKITIGSIFLICSVSYFIPKLMNHELNYTANINTYYCFGKQLVHSSKIMTKHYCCDTPGTTTDSLICATTDSNFNVMNANLSMHYDLNFAEATKYFDDLKVNITSAKGK